MTTTKIRQQEKWAALLYAAQQKGAEAGAACTPPAMVVYTPKVPFIDETPDLSQPVYREPDGPCGFAWLNLKAAPGPEGKEARQFLNWLTGRTKPAAPHCAPVGREFRLPDKKSYYGGYDIWVSGFRQSMARKEDAARAMAAVLREIPGLRCWPMSRMD